MNVLVTCGGGFQGLTIQKELASLNGVKSFLVDINTTNLGKYFFDYSEVSPKVAEKERYIEFLKDFCRRNKIDFVIPATAIDLSLLSAAKSEFETALKCNIIVPDMDIVHTFSDKKHTTDFLLTKGIKVQLPFDLNEEGSYPIIGKYRWGWGGKGIHIFHTQAEYLASTGINEQDYVWSSYLNQFTEYSIDFSVNSSGLVSEPLYRTRDFVSGGFAVISTVTNHIPEVILREFEKIKTIFNSPKFSGIYNIQMLYSEDYCFISDVNPRIGTSAVGAAIADKSLLGHVINRSVKNDIKKSKNFTYCRYLAEKIYYNTDLREVKNVVFDLDDTLISNLSFTIERCALLYDVSSIHFGNKKDFLNICKAILSEGKASVLIDEVCRAFKIENSKDQILEDYRGCFPSFLKIYDDVEPILNYFKTQNIKLFVLTDNPVATQRKKWELFQFSHYFHGIEYTFLENRSKPDKEVFHKIIEKYGGESKEYMMVGDNYYRDCMGAINAGFSAAFHIHRKDGMVSSYFPNIENDESIFPIESLSDLEFYI
jgi:HAD superfamily hydrolase (TIGR01549 family)